MSEMQVSVNTIRTAIEFVLYVALPVVSIYGLGYVAKKIVGAIRLSIKNNRLWHERRERDKQSLETGQYEAEFSEILNNLPDPLWREIFRSVNSLTKESEKPATRCQLATDIIVSFCDRQAINPISSDAALWLMNRVMVPDRGWGYKDMDFERRNKVSSAIAKWVVRS